MEAGITNRVWSVDELVTRALAAEPCDAPQPKPLAPPSPLPGEKPVTARQTSTGLWLRVVPGGKGKGLSNDPPRAPTPPPVVRYAAAVVEDYEAHWNEMDFKLRKQQEKRMDFFGEDSDNNPNW